MIIDVYNGWCGPCEAMNPCYKNLHTQVIDDFEKRVDIILVSSDKLEKLENEKFKCTSRPKLLLAL